MNGGIRIDIDPGPIYNVKDNLANMRQRLDNPSALMNIIAIIMRRSFAENFNAGGRPQTWKPLTPGTLMAKMKMFREGLIRGRRHGIRVRASAPFMAGNLPGTLILTGHLKDAASRKGVQGNIHRLAADGRTLVVGVGTLVDEDGVRSDYPLRHQEGREEERLPQRMFIMVQDEDYQTILKATEDYIAGLSLEKYRRGGSD